MDSALHSLLLDRDNASGFEVPDEDWRAFPYQELANSVERIRERLLGEAGVSFTRDGNVQDASFHDELRVQVQQSGTIDRSVAAGPDFAIRFSNFGRLFTIWSGPTNDPGRYPTTLVLDIVREEGWTYVPAEQLDEVYDGLNERLRDGRTTWWIRFFDYL